MIFSWLFILFTVKILLFFYMKINDIVKDSSTDEEDCVDEVLKLSE